MPLARGTRLGRSPGGLPSGAGASFFPDNRRILVLASEAGRPQRLFSQELDGGPPRAASPEGLR